MQTLGHEIYSFDEFRLDLTRGALFRDDTEIKLRPKSFEVLRFLAAHQGRLVSKDELMQAVWPDTAVTDDSLVQCLKDVRRALGDSEQAFIKTVPRRGYIFDIDVKRNEEPFYVGEMSGVRLVMEESIADDGVTSLGPGRQRRSLSAIFKHHKLAVGSSVLILLLISGAITYGVLVLSSRTASSRFRSISISRLTNNGNVNDVAISPDGKYVAFTVRENDAASVWIRQVADVNPKQLLPPDQSGYTGLIFSPDSDFLYYNRVGVLFKVAALGGTPRVILQGVHGSVTFSPDGKKIAFIRGGEGSGGQDLVIADSDGLGVERTLAARKAPQFFALPMFGTGPAWSPDGSVIACPAVDNGGFGEAYPLEVLVADGSQRPITEKRWNAVVQLAWEADGSALFMNAKDNGIDATRQVWSVSFPSGVPERVYSDDAEYDRISYAPKSSFLVSVRREVQTNIRAIDVGSILPTAVEVTKGSGRQDGYWGMGTTPDGKLVLDSRAGRDRDLWIMDADGGNQKQLTFDSLMEAFTDVSPDGRYILFQHGGKGLVTMDLNSGTRLQLTDEIAMFPTFSADGNWVYYSLPREKWSLWRMPSSGGEPIKVLDRAMHPVVSPDGRLLAYISVTPGSQSKIRIVPIEGDAAVREFPIQGKIRWIPDAKGITYISTTDGLEQIVTQGLDESAPKVIFTARNKSEVIRDFTWARDGKRLFFAIGPVTKDVVIFTLDR